MSLDSLSVGRVGDRPPRPSRDGAWDSLRHVAADASCRTPWLWWGGWAALALSVPLLILQWQDPRLLQGVSVWTKPWKFHVSTGVHLLTLAWFAALLPDTLQRRKSLGKMTVVALLSAAFELAYITWRASRGEASHFNIASPLAGALYAVMGVGAVLLTACAGWLGLHILRARDFGWGPVLQRGIGLGLLLGCILGTLSGAYVSAQTGHHVGGSLSDAQGLPVFRWSTDGGDLRVAHFFGLHAMQVLPLVAWVAARFSSSAAALRQVNIFIAAYTALTVFTFVQALQGRPLI